MPASRRKRVRRLAAGVSASALAVVALSPSARAFDRELTVGPAASSGWQGRAALFSRASPFDPATLTPCGSSIADVCDTTLLHVDPASTGSLQVRLSAVDANTPDVDLYVYRSDPLGLPGRLEGVSAGPGPDEQVNVPAASGSYLVSAVSFSAAVIGPAGFRADALLAARPTTPPDLDDPRGLRDVLVSDPDAGAAEQPA